MSRDILPWQPTTQCAMACRQRPVVITGFWALASLLVCSAAYMINRASGNLRDTYQEHTIMSILTVSPLAVFQPITVILPLYTSSYVQRHIWLCVDTALLSVRWCASWMSLTGAVRESGLRSSAQAFDEETGRPTQPVEMVEWPCHRYMLDNGFPQKHLRR